MNIDQLHAEVAAKGMTYDGYKKEVEKEIRRIKFINQVIGPQVKISDQDLRDYYERKHDNFRVSTQAQISEIVLPFEGITTEEEAMKLKDTAITIVTKARSKGGNFTELARTYSKGPNAENGGDLGMTDLKTLSPRVSDVIREMKVGDISNPIPTENGLIIVKLVSVPEINAKDFETMRDRIYSSLYEERIQETLGAYLQKERQKAFIEIR
jgi:parvulin-like peptidyl-prolyl isomerase